MNAKLYKTEKENYVLVDPTKGTYDDGYTLGTSRESQFNKLSIKNCQAIERGYDLDELCEVTFEHMGYHSTVTPHEEKQFKLGYKLAFQKALEILGDKKFTKKDMFDAVMLGVEFEDNGIKGIETYDELLDLVIQRNTQTEWDVEIEMVPAMSNNGNVYYGDIPKLDADGCLILKRID